MDPISRARTFFQTNGRDLDRARFAYHFGTGTQDELLEVLGSYQNPDGGFRGLEVDIAAPVSNPFATELALQICLQADVPRRHPLLTRTVAFLEETQAEDGCWRFSLDVYKHELAPWFAGRTLPTAGLNRQLDRLEAEQAEDGGWPSPYSEGWRGWVTVNALLQLKAFGRI